MQAHPPWPHGHPLNAGKARVRALPCRPAASRFACVAYGHRSEQALPALLPRFTPVWPVITSLSSSPSCTVTHTFGLRGLSRHKRFPPASGSPHLFHVPHIPLFRGFHATFYGDELSEAMTS